MMPHAPSHEVQSVNAALHFADRNGAPRVQAPSFFHRIVHPDQPSLSCYRHTNETRKFVDPKANVAPPGNEVWTLINCVAVSGVVWVVEHEAGKVPVVVKVQATELAVSPVDVVAPDWTCAAVPMARATVAVPEEPEAPLGLKTVTFNPCTVHAVGTGSTAERKVAPLPAAAAVEPPLGAP